MVKKIFSKKLIALFISMAIIGFFLGYDYALITAKYGDMSMINLFKQTDTVNEKNKTDIAPADEKQHSFPEVDEKDEL